MDWWLCTEDRTASTADTPALLGWVLDVIGTALVNDVPIASLLAAATRKPSVSTSSPLAM
jgi:hypothetical protein